MTPLSIGALAQRTGVSERAIRLYEQHGLLKPRRTAAGRRIFGESDLQALLNVVALREVGCSLKEIVSLAARDTVEVRSILSLWQDSVAAQQARLTAVAQQLQNALEHIDRGEHMSMDTLCALLVRAEERGADRTALIARWFSQEERAAWQQANERAGQARIGGAVWSRLLKRVAEAIARRTPPDSAEGSKLGAECMALMDRMCGGVETGLWNRGVALMQQGALAEDSDTSQQMQRVVEWLRRAVEHRRAQSTAGSTRRGD